MGSLPAADCVADDRCVADEEVSATPFHKKRRYTAKGSKEVTARLSMNCIEDS